MKSSKWILITALLYATAGICFAFASILHTEMPPKVLCGIAAICLLVAGTGFFSVYVRKKKAHDKQSNL